MGQVYEVPFLPVDVGGWDWTGYENLSEAQKTRYNTLKNGGFKFLRYHFIYGDQYGDSYYGRANQTSKVYFAMYGSNNIARGYLRRSDDATTFYTLEINDSSSFSSISDNISVTSTIYHRNLENDPRTFYPADGILMYSSYEEALAAISVANYPITYHYTNSTVSGPSEAVVGDTVTVSAVPNNNYGITDPASQILVTNNDVAVSYQWNSSTNTITFVMPEPT